MKKTLALLLAALMMVAVVFCGCTGGETSSTPDATTETKTDTLEKVTFTVGFDAEFPPYGYKDKDGEYTGVDLELAEEVCKRQGWELVKQPIDWDSKDMELTSGTIDCIWNGFTMTGREKDYTWSSPYIDNSQVIVVKADSDISSLDDLSGKVVAVQSDSSALAAFTGDDATDANKKLCASFAELQQIGDYNSALMNLDSGAVDAVGMDIGVANYNLSNNEGKYKILDDQISTEQYAVGFKKGNTELRDTVEKTLKEMYEDGTFMKIVDKYNDKYGISDSVCFGE